MTQDLFPLYKPLPPFMNYPNGFGYMGVILQSSTTGKIQCHLCGQMFKSVARHISHKHDIAIDDYKELVGLNKHTPLVCENTSKTIRQNFINLSEIDKNKRIKILQNNNAKIHKERLYRPRKTQTRIQFLNKNGTCDLQAKYYFWEEYNKLGRIPTNKEMTGRLRSLIYTRFDSYENALKYWGIGNKEFENYTENNMKKSYLARAKQNFFPKYKKDEVLNQTKNFFNLNKRLPTWEEAKRTGLPSREVFKRLFGTNRKEELERLILT